MQTIEWDDFERVHLCAGTIVAVDCPERLVVPMQLDGHFKRYCTPPLPVG